MKREPTKIELAVEHLRTLPPPEFLKVTSGIPSWRVNDTGSGITAHVADLRVIESKYPTDSQILTAGTDKLASIMVDNLAAANEKRNRTLHVVIPPSGDRNQRFIVYVNGKPEYSAGSMVINHPDEHTKLVQLFDLAEPSGGKRALHIVDWEVWDEVHIHYGRITREPTVISKRAQARV